MAEALFMVLIAIVSIATAIYSYAYRADHKGASQSLMIILAMQLLSILYLDHWPVAALFIAFLAVTAIPVKSFKGLTFPNFVTLSMFSAVGLSYLFLKLFTLGEFNTYAIALVAAVAICALAVFGIKENNLRRFLVISNVIQITFVVLDLSVAKMVGHLGTLGTVQVFNYTFAGLLLFLSLGVFAYNKKFISELAGSQTTSRWNDAFCAIACLSLAGLPGFNIFVSEWALFTAAFTVNPGIAVLGIFAALLLFIMYYKLVFVLLVGEGRKEKAPRIMTAVNAVLAGIVILLGIMPQIQWLLLTGVFA